MNSYDRLRFAFYPGILGPTGGGASRSACLHASSLAERGLAVAVEGLQDAGGIGDLILHSCDTRTHPWIGSAAHPRSTTLLTRTHDLLRTVDVVHLNGHYQRWQHEVAALCRTEGVPYVISSRATLSPSTLAALPDGDRAELAESEAEYIDGAFAIHVTSRVEKQRAQAYLGTHPRVVTIPNAVALDDLRARGDAATARRRLRLPGGPVLLYYGRLIEEKQPAYAVEVLAHLPSDHHLFLVGAGQQNARAALLEQAAVRGVADRVHLAGYAHGPERGLWLAAADVLLVPSLMENFCLAVVEAVALGLPVVAAEHIGATEYLNPGDVAIVERDPCAWAEAVRSSLAAPPRDPEETFTRMREQFRPAVVLERWEPVYADVEPNPTGTPEADLTHDAVLAFARRHWQAVAPVSTGPVDVRDLTGGASRRLFLRLEDDSGRTAVAMGCPQRQGDFLAAPFDSTQPLQWLQVQRALSSAGLPVPEVVAADDRRGVLLVSHLGDSRLDLEIRARPAELRGLLSSAVELVLDLQCATDALDPTSLPRRRRLDTPTFVWEMFHHVEWAVEARYDTRVGARERLALLDHFTRLADELAGQEQVLVHRDLNATNLVPHGGGWGLVDFDDALMGPMTYDLCSLLLDVNLGLPRDLVDAMVARFHRRRTRRLPGTPDAAQFQRLFDLQAVQRNLKVAGRFVWLDRLGGTARYVGHVDTALAHVRHHLRRQPDLAPLRRALVRVDPALAD